MEIIKENDTIKQINRVSDFKSIYPVTYEVLDSDEAVSDRTYKLKKALVYGTRFNIKSEILVVTSQMIVRVVSVIYSIDKNFIELKGGVLLPIKSIYKVEYIY